MAASVTCPMCGKQCALPDPAPASEVRCPDCLSLIPVKPALASSLLGRSVAEPATFAGPPNRTILAQPEPMIRFICPRCKKSLESPASSAGQKLHCPDCNQRLQIPQPSTPAAPPINKTILATEDSPAAAAKARPPAPLVPTVPTVKVVTVGEAVEPIEVAPARRENCLECGVDVTRRSRVQTCPDCGSIFCSAACYREHNQHAHARAAKPKKRSRPVECDYCGSTEPPYRTSQISQAGWIVFALMLVFFFPLFWIGLLMTETQYKCRDCGARLD